MKPLTEEQKVSLGMMAKALLSQEVVQEFHELTTHQLAYQMLMEPDANKRHVLHFTHQGLIYLFGLMEDFSSAAEEIIKKREAEAAAVAGDDDQSHPYLHFDTEIESEDD
jgi:hypothetical protein